MTDRAALDSALSEIRRNPEQFRAVNERRHCIVLAGPGSGKTKTLTVAMARALVEDVPEPAGIACITYNNECAFELQSRLLKLGVESDERIYIGTVHSFALAEIIAPYARIAYPGFPKPFRVARASEVLEIQNLAYDEVIGDGGDVKERWEFANEKRFTDVERSAPEWYGRNEELARLIEVYEAKLRERGLVDFGDMPLLAYRMLQSSPWIRQAVRARFPVLFVDEYQDLGRALHELVLMICFDAGVRLFAVGDLDQSIYSFTGANPSLLEELSQRTDVETIKLRLNYRSGRAIIAASLAGLGEARDYEPSNHEKVSSINFRGVSGTVVDQARYVIESLIPQIREMGYRIDQIAVLYRGAKQGNAIADAARASDISIARADNNSLIVRRSRLSKLVEACAKWVTGGWKDSDPPFHHLSNEAASLLLGTNSNESERFNIAVELMTFLKTSLGLSETTNAWLQRVQRDLIVPWRQQSRELIDLDEWTRVEELIAKTDPASDLDMPLPLFAGRVMGSGQLTLSTLHSAKGREFDIVILFAMDDRTIPFQREKFNDRKLREARRLFYVGLSRARDHLFVTYRKDAPSPFLVELAKRLREVPSQSALA